MKTHLLLLSLLLAIALPSCRQKTETDHFFALETAFKNPSSEYRSAPLWSWNTDVNRSDVDRMLADFKEAGFGGAFIHPRPGMMNDYLSPEWFDIYRYCVEEGKKLGLDIWIYDENSYPSGFAGGHVPVEMPESYNQGQGLELVHATTLPEDAEGFYLCLKKENDTYKDITANLSEYERVEGDYYLYDKSYYRNSPWSAGYSYVDLLYPGVTEKFIDITMSGYEKTFGDELGPVVKGVFTDEPNIASPGGLRWTPDLFEVFQQKWGYDLKTHLPLLSLKEGNWKQVRHNYTETLLQLFIDRWAKPWFNYCEEKNMHWTGHYWEHGWPDMSHGGDNMAMYAWHQMPAIDMLFNQFDEVSPQAQFGNIRAVKELRSVANQMGYKRTLSETYGGAGWEATFEDFKRLGDWEYVLGVNFLNQHISHVTLTGARKSDYPPLFTAHSPWWNDYKSQNDYFARLSLLLSKGEQMNDILVLEPTSTIWAYYSYVDRSEEVMKIGTNFQAFVTQLEKAQAEYDLGSENIIKDNGSVANGRFIVGKRAYQKVVIPPMTENINKPTFDLLRQFVEQGGELILFSSPSLIDGKENTELAQFINRETPQIKKYNSPTNQVITDIFQNEKIRFSRINGTSLYHQRRTYAEGELIFLVNASLEETVKGNLTIDGATLLEADAMDGNLYAYPHQVENEKVSTSFTLPPAGSLLLFSSSRQSGSYPQKQSLTEKERIPAQTELVVQRMRDNVLALDFCDLIIDGKENKHLHTVDARERLYKHFGYPGDPWNQAVQYRKVILEKDTFQTGDIRVRYHLTIPEKMDMSSIQAVIEQPGIWNLTINNTPVKPKEGEYWLDARWGIYPIGQSLRTGENTIEISMSPMSIFAEIEPAYITGDFSVQPTRVGWTIHPPVTALQPSSWKDQGLPFYSWEMSYSKNYQITDPQSTYFIQLDEWNGSVAEVWVNNQKAGIIATQPYKLNISPSLHEGDNKIDIRVVGNLKNLLGPHHNNPQLGFIRPWYWSNVKGEIPGEGYQLLDYGLMKDYTLWKTE